MGKGVPTAALPARLCPTYICCPLEFTTALRHPQFRNQA